MMKHRGYTACVEYDQEDKILVGKVIGIRDGINFHGTTKDEIKTALTEAVDNYLAMCEDLGQKPEMPTTRQSEQ